jgi:glutathione S-transferase
MAAYELYWFPGTCARVPYVALEEIGEPFDLVVVDRSGQPRKNDYRGAVPQGQVPALGVGDQIITENLAIQQYLAGRHPDAGLLPSGSPELAAQVLEMQSWFASWVHPLVRQLRLPRFVTDDQEAYPSVRAKAQATLREPFSKLEARLEDREWLFDEWSLVDVHMLWLWFRATGSGFDGSEFTACQAHAQRCESRPSVAKVLQHEDDEWAHQVASGKVPPYVPREFQAGHAPVYATG